MYMYTYYDTSMTDRKIKPLNKLTDELEQALNKFRDTLIVSMPQVCPMCKNFYVDRINQNFIRDLGECAMCDHVRGETLNEK